METKVSKTFSALWLVTKDLPGLIALGVFFSIVSFFICLLVATLWSGLLSLFHISQDEILTRFVDIIWGKAGDPLIDRLKAIFDDPCGRVLSTVSTAIGASATTHVATSRRSREQTREWLNQYSWCDESYDLKSFLEEISTAMKKGSSTFEANPETARMLLAAWDRHRARFAPMTTDYNGDFARLRTLLEGDKVPGSEQCGSSDYIKNEIIYLLDRIAKSAELRRGIMISGMENLLAAINAVEDGATAKRTKVSTLNEVTLWVSITFGIALMAMIIQSLLTR